MSLPKPEKLIKTKSIVPESSDCHHGKGIAIKTEYNQEVIIIAKDCHDLLGVVGDLCGHNFKVDMNGVKNVTVFGTKDTAEVESVAVTEEEKHQLSKSQ